MVRLIILFSFFFNYEGRRGFLLPREESVIYINVRREKTGREEAISILGRGGEGRESLHCLFRLPSYLQDGKVRAA